MLVAKIKIQHPNHYMGIENLFVKLCPRIEISESHHVHSALSLLATNVTRQASTATTSSQADIFRKTDQNVEETLWRGRWTVAAATQLSMNYVEDN
jgi:hypothetical protein